MISKYINVEGRVIEYEYVRNSYRDTKHKPSCPICSKKKSRSIVNYVEYTDVIKKKLGFICKVCKSVFISNEFDVFKIKK